MVDINYYKKLLFNKETGKERYGLIPKEAEKIFKENSLENCWDIAMEYYNYELYYIQMMAVYIFGLIGNKKALNFLKNNISKNPSWQVQEFLAMAFDIYCKKNGYKKSLEIIKEWLENKNANVRRAVIEGLRIWTKRPYFEDNPQEAINIISKYKMDESEYVRKSVGNSLDLFNNSKNDIIPKWAGEKRYKIPKGFFLNGCMG